MSTAQALLLDEHAYLLAAQAASSTSADAQDPIQANRVKSMSMLLSAMMLGQLMDQKDDAKRIFDAMAVVIGDGRQLRISLAFASAISGDAAPAKELLAEGVDDWPEPEMSQLALSMALKYGGDPEWKRLPEYMLAASADDDVRDFARRLLEPA